MEEHKLTVHGTLVPSSKKTSAENSHQFPQNTNCVMAAKIHALKTSQFSFESCVICSTTVWSLPRIRQAFSISVRSMALIISGSSARAASAPRTNTASSTSLSSLWREWKSLASDLVWSSFLLCRGFSSLRWIVGSVSCLPKRVSGR